MESGAVGAVRQHGARPLAHELGQCGPHTHPSLFIISRFVFLFIFIFLLLFFGW